MARIRTIKPSFWGDDDVCKLSRDARLLLVGLISMADDDGRFIATPAAVAGYVFPHEDIPTTKIRRWLAEIAETPMLTLYAVETRQYGVLPNYRKHQRISHPQPSPLPAPPQEGPFE
jgi:hypothetical protein